MTTANTDITRTSTDDNTGPSTGKYGILTQFQATITAVVNGLSKIAADTTNPFFYNAPVAGVYSSDDFGGVVPLSSGQSITPSPQTGDIPAGNIVASALVTLFQNTAVALSQVRTYSLVKWYNTGVNVFQVEYASTGHAVMGGSPWAGIEYMNFLAAYQMAPPAIVSGPNYPNVDASDLDAVVASVFAALTAHANTTVLMNEYWCHTSCHASHSSRARR